MAVTEMKAFATKEEMAQRTGGLITDTTHPFLEKELEAATRAIRNVCGWHIAGLEERRFRRNGPFPFDVWLPAMQIEEITSATVDGVTVNPASVSFDHDTGWTSLRGNRIDITYRAGFEQAPEDIMILTLELAAAGLTSPLGITKEQAGGVSITLDRASSSLLGADLERLTPYMIGTRA